jgi:hypothetical protein
MDLGRHGREMRGFWEKTCLLRAIFDKLRDTQCGQSGMSKLSDTISLLSKKEFLAFTSFIHSPYFCQHEETIRFHDFLASFYPDFPDTIYEAFRETYPGQSLSKARFNVLNSYLLEYLYRFLAQEEFAQQPVAEKSYLVENLRKRGSFNEAKKQLDLAIEVMDDPKWIESSNFTSRIRLRELELNLALSTEMRNSDLSLRELFSALDQHYLIFSLKYLLPALSMNRLFSHRFPTERWKKVQEMLENVGGEAPVLIQIFNHLVLLLQGHSKKEHLPPLMELLDHHGHQLARVELINAFGNLQNYFTQRLLRGDKSALSSLFEVFQKMDGHGIIFGQGEFSGHTFRNIVVIGCRLSELEWTSTFLEKNRNAISDELGGNALGYSEAYLDFYRADYPSALKKLHQLEFVDPFYRTGHQVLMLRIHYEQDDYESLEALSRTFRRFLNRTDSVSENQKTQNRNFISVLHQLAKTKEKGTTKTRLQKIKEMLETGGEVTDRTWLNEKLKELEVESKK